MRVPVATRQLNLFKICRLALPPYKYVWPACSINKQECNAAIEGDTLEKGRKLLPACVCVC